MSDADTPDPQRLRDDLAALAARVDALEQKAARPPAPADVLRGIEGLTAEQVREAIVAVEAERRRLDGERLGLRRLLGEVRARERRALWRRRRPEEEPAP